MTECTMKYGNYRQDNDMRTFANIFLYKPPKSAMMWVEIGRDAREATRGGEGI